MPWQQCPSCGKETEHPDALAGELAPCEGCGEESLVPNDAIRLVAGIFNEDVNDFLKAVRAKFEELGCKMGIIGMVELSIYLLWHAEGCLRNSGQNEHVQTALKSLFTMAADPGFSFIDLSRAPGGYYDGHPQISFTELATHRLDSYNELAHVLRGELALGSSGMTSHALLLTFILNAGEDAYDVHVDIEGMIDAAQHPHLLEFLVFTEGSFIAFFRHMMMGALGERDDLLSVGREALENRIEEAARKWRRQRG